MNECEQYCIEKEWSYPSDLLLNVFISFIYPSFEEHNLLFSMSLVNKAFTHKAFQKSELRKKIVEKVRELCFLPISELYMW